MTNTFVDLPKLYEEGDFRSLIRSLPHLWREKDPFVEALNRSNILEMGPHLEDPKITLGADPEFILCEKDNPDKVVLFSSEYADDYFGLSAAELGADYGLLELRPKPEEKVKHLISSFEKLEKDFGRFFPKLSLLKKEAIEYDHKKQRVLEELLADREINYGMGRGKDLSVWGGDQDIITGIETGQKISAYDQPIFNQYDPNVLTAGGHIHVGGRYIMMLSLEQIKAFVRLLEDKVFPLCREVETGAAELRRTVYGNRGEFCIKPYGIEWRSPSNSIFWPENRKVLRKVLKNIKKLAKKFLLLGIEGEPK